MKYDIFISYRRKDSSGRSNVATARQLKMAFERSPYNFKVFFDYSECTDDYFSEKILPAIRTCDFFVLVLTKDCLSRCFNEGDWVRKEIEEALANNIKVVPITPDNECDAWPKLPDSLSKLEGLQITTIHTDHMFEAGVDFLVKNRFHKIDVDCIDSDEDNEHSILRQERIEVKLKDIPENEKLFTVNGVSFKMLFVKGGTFWMGAHDRKVRMGIKWVIDNSIPNYNEDAKNNESPVHKVTLSDFYIGETVVTQGLWKAVTNSNPSHSLGDDLPVETVSWKDCHSFIDRLNGLTGMHFRLPTEAEWEFAAKGGNETRKCWYAGDDNIEAVAWYKDNSEGKTHPVKEKKCNEIGLFDMSGNVWEWCEDYYTDYEKYDQTNPIANDGDYKYNVRIRDHVIRGGGFNAKQKECRLTSRSDNGSQNYDIGFRLVLSEASLERVKRIIDRIKKIRELRDGKE